jgi:hypothetical protein
MSTKKNQTSPADAGTGAAAQPSQMERDLREALAMLRQAGEKIKPYIVSVPDAEFQRSFKIGRGREPFVREFMRQVRAHAALVLNADEQIPLLAEKYAAWDLFGEIAAYLDVARQMTRKTQYAEGTELYGAGADWVRALTDMGRRGDAAALEIARQLTAKRPSHGGGRPPSPDDDAQPPLPDESPQTV